MLYGLVYCFRELNLIDPEETAQTKFVHTKLYQTIQNYTKLTEFMAEDLTLVKTRSAY